MRCLSQCCLALGLALSSASCVRLSWNRAEFCRPVPEQAVEQLDVGTTELSSCLEQFGSPLYVWQTADEEYAVAYGWDYDTGWGFNVSVPVAQDFSASVDFDDLNRRLHGVVLTFDDQHRLIRKKRGFLVEIAAQSMRKRPAVVDQEAEAPREPSP